MPDNAFRIEVLQQGWLGDTAEAAADDLCSHGRLRITIGGQIVASGTEEFGISETALALLRTLERDHSAANPVAGSFPGEARLVYHGCGTMLMMGCPIGMDWQVEHLPGDRVRLSNVRRFDTTNDAEAVTFPGLEVEVDEVDYRRAVTRFAREAKQLFTGISKTPQEDWDRQQYEQFWQEFDRLLAKFG